MFTGIVTAMGRIEKVDASRPDVRYVVSTPWNMEKFATGASILCSGCCLTVIEKSGNSFAVDVSRETLSKTNLGKWAEGTRINLEPSLKIGDELGGHIASGHVDGLAVIESITPEDGSHRVRLRAPDSLSAFIAPKGSIALDGVSLTVNEVEGNVFGVNIIPHTWEVTTFGQARPGDVMNLEVDLFSRYVARILSEQTGLLPDPSRTAQAFEVMRRNNARLAGRVGEGMLALPGVTLSTPEEIIGAARQGRMFILVDAETRENEGDLVIPAQHITPAHVAFMAREGRGLVCLAMEGAIADRLNLKPAGAGETRFGTAFLTPIGAREGITTGISAADRAHTIKTAIAPDAAAKDIVTPGHVFPLRARDGGVTERPGHTEAAVDIARLAGLRPAAVLCEIMNDDGTMARLPDLVVFARRHNLRIGTIADLVAYRRSLPPLPPLRERAGEREESHRTKSERL